MILFFMGILLFIHIFKLVNANNIFFCKSLYLDNFKYFTRNPVVVALINKVRRATPRTCNNIISWTYLDIFVYPATSRAKHIPTAPLRPAYELKTNWGNESPYPILERQGQNIKRHPNLIKCKIVYDPSIFT